MYRKSCLVFALMVIFSLFMVEDVSAQAKMRVQGTVLAAENQEPIVGVQILCGGFYVGTTDYDGRYSLVVPRDGTLDFMYAPCNSESLVLTGNPELAPVYMQQKNVMMEAVQVVAKAKTKKIKVEPTDIEVKGNYYFLPTKFTIPTSVFSSDHRFIVQPTIYNVSKQKRFNLRPIVINGSNYEKIIYRSLGFDKKADKLNKYVVDFDVSRKNDIYVYCDSLYFDPKNKDDDIRADCYLLLAGFDKPARDIDTVTIAKGTQNVMRFFSYKLSPMTLGGKIVDKIEDCDQPLADSCDVRFIPTPDLELRGDAGEAKINFAVNETKINQRDKDNARSLKEIGDTLQALQSDVDVTLKAISMIGYASPEGNYASNKRLADMRTSGLLNIVTSDITPDVLAQLKLESRGVVQKWSMLIDLIAKDNPELSKKVAEVIKSTGDDFVKTPAALRKLPEYYKIISPKYLPQLRRVEYRIEYSKFRILTDDEIMAKYEESVGTGEALTRYEYYRLIAMERDRTRREEMEDLAIKYYHNFAWALNRVAVRGVLRDSVNLEMLKPLLKDRKPPVPIIYNQTLSALVEQNLGLADSLMMTIPEETLATMEYAQAVISALNGYYEDALPVISKDGGLNPILLLLGMKRNDAAYNMMKLLMQQNPASAADPHMLYTMAQCANRLVPTNVSYLGEAISYMSMLVGMFPDVAAIAQGDSDVMDLYRLVTNPQVSTSGGAKAEEKSKLKQWWAKVTKIFKGSKSDKKESTEDSKKGKKKKSENDKEEPKKEPKEEAKELELDPTRADGVANGEKESSKKKEKKEKAPKEKKEKKSKEEKREKSVEEVKSEGVVE